MGWAVLHSLARDAIKQDRAKTAAILRQRAADLAPENDWGDSMADTVSADALRWAAQVVEAGAE